MIERFVVLGASGDLTRRYLLPALLELRTAGRLSPGLRVLGLDRNEWTTEAFREEMRRALAEHAPAAPHEAKDALLAALDYRAADVTDAGALGRALGSAPLPLVAYLALPPAIFFATVRALEDVGLPAASKIVLEKPFGEDLASAKVLNDLLHEAFPEESIFRMDHFLGEQALLDLVSLRRLNPLLAAAWGREQVERVEITWDESLTLEGRANYYDRAGALKDMVQSHLLQVLALVAMEAPAADGDLRDRRAAVLRSVRPPEDVSSQTLRARYTSGRLGGQAVPAYVDEAGIDAARETETFARVTLWVDSGRWAGVPFVLRTGKALARPRSEVVLRFRAPPPGVPGDGGAFRVRVAPDGLTLALLVESRVAGGLETVELGRDLPSAPLSAYALLLRDILDGDPALTVRDDEAEESWRIVEPVIDSWRKGVPPLFEYAAGSGGPEGA